MEGCGEREAKRWWVITEVAILTCTIYCHPLELMPTFGNAVAIDGALIP